jgi:hypothetical protein
MRKGYMKSIVVLDLAVGRFPFLRQHVLSENSPTALVRHRISRMFRSTGLFVRSLIEWWVVVSRAAHH